MLNPASVPDVADVEVLARFAIGKRVLRENGTLKENQLLPPPCGKLSVMRHLDATEQEIWDEGREVARLRAKNLVGRLDFTAGYCRTVGLHVIKDPLVAEPPSKPEPRRRLANPNHADLVFPSVGEPGLQATMSKPDRLAIAKALSAIGGTVIKVPADADESATPP
jgi:hypothetical protein